MDKETMIRRLNEDLAGELMAVHQYLTYAARVEGPFRPQLKAFFESEIPDELGHAQFLAEKVVALGGEPNTQARPVPQAETPKRMLEEILKAEQKAIADYTQRAQEAEEFGDKGLQVRLEDIVADETGHKEETERILMTWPL